MDTKKVLFCWSDFSGYMVACWKALHTSESIDLHIIAFGKSGDTSFQQEMTSGLQINFIDSPTAYNKVNRIVEDLNPDYIVLCGWYVPAYKKLADDKNLLKTTKFIMAMDTPWWGKPKQQIAPYVLKTFTSKMVAVITSGERSYQYAQRLGAKKVFKIQYGVDATMLKQAYDSRVDSDWPTRFLFVGRFAEVKGIDIMVEAYKNYRAEVSNPWELDVCGQGPLQNLLEIEGINNHGFTQPAEMLEKWTNAGCLVLASTFDPWPLIVVEACAAGLPVIVTHASGSQVEVVKMFYNGLVVNESNAIDLKAALFWMHKNYIDLPEMGKRSLSQAAPYDAAMWAKKINFMIEGLD